MLYYYSRPGTPRSFDPVSLFDSDTAGLVWEYLPQYLSQDVNGTVPVTQDGDPVGRVFDRTGKGNHGLQPSDSLRPIYHTDGFNHWVESTGTQWLRASFTLPQPFERINALRQGAWVNNDRLLGGSNLDLCVAFQTGTAPNIAIYAGTVLPITADPAIGDDFVLTERYNGVSSRAAINNGAYDTGNAGTSAGSGFTLFTNGNANPAGTVLQGRAYFSLVRAGLMSDDQIALARTYAANAF